MRTEIIIPHVGETTRTVRITRWLKNVGDPVVKGEAILEVETDKAVLEIEAYEDGILDEVVVQEDEEADALQVVGYLRSTGEDAEEARAVAERAIRSPEQAAAAIAATAAETGISATPVARRLADELGVQIDSVEGTGPHGRVTQADVRRMVEERSARAETGQGRVRASPKARQLAKELGVELRAVAGTGADGLVTSDDVRRTSAAGDRIHALPKIRRVIAERMSLSKKTVPHFYLMVDADMSGAKRLRGHCTDELGWERPPTYTDIVVRATALAVAGHPELNVEYREEASGWVQRLGVGIGVAVSVPDGLIVPVVGDADRLTLQETSDRIRQLTQRARVGRLRAEDFGEKSLVVSNLGMYGVDAFIAIIDVPDPMIVAVGKVADRVAVEDGLPIVRPMATLTLSGDHRVLDGVQAAEFLRDVKRLVESPFDLVR
jgi:pyruvate dehydrogenase E2 component (dihydrolipoamide acetyltransferase)